MGAFEVEETQHEQGWNYTDGWVCAECVEDYALADALRTAQQHDHKCDFCKAVPAADLNVLLEAFFDGLHSEYASAEQEAAYFERELVAPQHWWGDELVDEYAGVLRGEELCEAVRQAARNDWVWVERDFIAPRRERALREGWERFCAQVKYTARFVFFLTEPAEDERHLGAGEIPAAEILHAIGELLPAVGLLRDLPAGHRLWRARTHAHLDPAWGARDLGTASPDQAVQPNRMSPVGIPLFYGAHSAQTAVREVQRHAPDHAWITYTAFETSQPCTVVDFTCLNPVPSIFDPHYRGLRRAMMFLHDFVAALSADHDGQEHLEYVPTQVVTEYLLRVLGQPDRPLAGLVYTSAADPSGRGQCTVLDVPQTHCFDPGHNTPDTRLSLHLVPNTLHTHPLPRT